MKKRQTLEELRMTRVALECGVPVDMVKSSIDVLFKYMKTKIEKPILAGMPLISQEEFEKTVPIIKIPALGFMVPSYKKYAYIKANEEKKLKQKQ
jgi:hypothetical protein